MKKLSNWHGFENIKQNISGEYWIFMHCIYNKQNKKQTFVSIHNEWNKMKELSFSLSFKQTKIWSMLSGTL